MFTELPHPVRRERLLRSRSHEGTRNSQVFRDSDIHHLVGGTAEVLGAEARQEVFGNRFQQWFNLDFHPHVDQGLILERVCLRV